MRLKLFCLLILGIFACNKVNQWKQPTKVCFNVDITTESALNGKLSLNEGYLAIQDFVFWGTRAEGADVYFEKRYSSILNAVLGEEKIKELSFDIPQGVYTNIKIELSTASNDLPNLVISGVYESNAGAKIPVRFEFNESDMFSIEGMSTLPNTPNVQLVENIKANATILLNAAKWFEAVQIDQLERATKIIIDGQSTILINKQTNAHVYNSIVVNINKEEPKAIFS